MDYRDVVSYSSLISAYAKWGDSDEALGLFLKMQLNGICPNSFTLVAVFTACIRDPDLHLILQLHAVAVKIPDHLLNLHVQNALMAAYFRSGLLDYATQVFERMEFRDTTSWNTAISGMIDHGMRTRAMEIFQKMRKTGMNGDSFTISSVLSCSAVGMHAHAVKTGLEFELTVGNSLISFYTNIGNSLEEGRKVFDQMYVRDLLTWNGMIRAFMVYGKVESAIRVFSLSPLKNGISYNILLSGFLHNGEPLSALKVFLEMVEGGIEISDFTLVTAITASGKLGGSIPQQIHGFATKSGGGSSDRIAAALMNMYVSFDKLSIAEKIFHRWDHPQSRGIAFTILISGYSADLQLDKALDLFLRMQIEVPEIDEVALTVGLSLVAELGLLSLGRQLHVFLCKSGILLADSKIWNSLISMYAKCGDLDKANNIFASMPNHDTVSWNALISAHLLHRRGDKTYVLMKLMEKEGVKPDAITIRLLISANQNSVHDLLSLSPTPANYAAAVEAMAAAGELEKAAELARSSPESHCAWQALLRRNSGGVEAVRSFLGTPPKDIAARVLASNLYATMGRWHCAEEARKKVKEMGMKKIPVRSWFGTESFYSRDQSRENSKDIYACLEILIAESLKKGYEPDTRFVLQEVEEFQKREFVFFHSAKLAVAYGHMVTPLGKAIKVVKNVRLCGDCHRFLKVFTVITGREVLLRDSTGFHFFKDGHCSCSERW